MVTESETILTTRGVSEWLHIHENQVYNLVAAGMPHLRTGVVRGRGGYRFEREAVREWLAGRVTKGEENGVQDRAKHDAPRQTH